MYEYILLSKVQVNKMKVRNNNNNNKHNNKTTDYTYPIRYNALHMASYTFLFYFSSKSSKWKFYFGQVLKIWD
jgi:hypothetical protein